ncbi:MAG: ORF6N domain-containing protein [Chthoniobacterales bacterium]
MKQKLIPVRQVAHRINFLRGHKVLLDFDLAELYQIETRARKQAVRRNRDRFPADFLFELSAKEIEIVVSQFVIPGRRKLGDAIGQVMTPQPKPHREIGFQVRETSPRYRTQSRR